MTAPYCKVTDCPEGCIHKSPVRLCSWGGARADWQTPTLSPCAPKSVQLLCTGQPLIHARFLLMLEAHCAAPELPFLPSAGPVIAQREATIHSSQPHSVRTYLNVVRSALVVGVRLQRDHRTWKVWTWSSPAKEFLSAQEFG